MGIDWKEWTKNFITVVIVIICIVGFVWWVHDSNIKACQQLEGITGYSTEYISGQCWIELCPDINITEDDLVYYLSICD